MTVCLLLKNPLTNKTQQHQLVIISQLCSDKQRLSYAFRCCQTELSFKVIQGHHSRSSISRSGKGECGISLLYNNFNSIPKGLIYWLIALKICYFASCSKTNKLTHILLLFWFYDHCSLKTDPANTWHHNNRNHSWTVITAVPLHYQLCDLC